MSAAALIAAARELSAAVAPMRFGAPVTHVYNPLDYAWAPHEQYLRKFGEGDKRVVFVGMNPGPFGMVQIGVPFGEIAAARDWMKIDAPVARPAEETAARPIEGWACPRSEVSGRRLWGLFAERFGSAELFFKDHLVANYCPLAFFEGRRNVTPDKLPSAEQSPLLAACDAHLRQLVETTRAQWVIGIGAWSELRARAACAGMADLNFGRVLHPSPASPAANRGWSEAATRQLGELGVWR